jgi:predicted small secreted protein
LTFKRTAKKHKMMKRIAIFILSAIAAFNLSSCDKIKITTSGQNGSK